MAVELYLLPFVRLIVLRECRNLLFGDERLVYFKIMNAASVSLNTTDTKAIFNGVKKKKQENRVI